VLASVLVGVALWRSSIPGEPVHAGRTLTQWLYPTDPDFEWISNDLYDHIHDALLEDLESGEPWLPIRTAAPLAPPETSPAHAAVRAIGTNAIPWLVDWMGAGPRPWERFRGFVNRHLAMPRFHPGGLPPVERRHVAALEGFLALGELAEPALPALSNLLCRPNPGLPLTQAIAAVGPAGIDVLTNALASGREDVRELAALSLGLEGPTAASAVPMLLTLIERGEAGYHVLGALGRIGCQPHQAVPPLRRQLDRVLAGEADDPCGMTVLLLGLCGEAARPAVPRLRQLYEQSGAVERRPIQAALQRIDPAAATRLPADDGVDVDSSRGSQRLGRGSPRE
jgi:hypothetical protein